jgi:hypothetical protein
VLVFGTEEGLAVSGTADASEVEIDDFGISGSVRLDCPGGSPFDGSPALEAYAIETFEADGSRLDPCVSIPAGNLEFFPDFDGDNAYLYIGAEGTDTTTSDATTTTISAVTTTTISG